MSNCQHCERPAYVRGLCIAHYQRLMKYGNALEPSHKRVRGTCSECGELAQSKGLCQGHYDKLRRRGALGGPLRGHMTRLELYTSYVDQRGPDDCWPWTGGRSPKNYGEFNSGDRSVTSAHRYGFSQLRRSLEPGETVDHTCHNRDPYCPGGDTCEHRACQNPAHWEAIDNWGNGSRGLSFSAVNARKVECKWGHDITDPANSYGYKGRRQCKTCARLAARGQHPRQLAAAGRLF